MLSRCTVTVVVAAWLAGCGRVAALFPPPFTDLSGSHSKSEPIEELDLLQAIAVPFSDPSTQYFVTGFDGFPAFGFKAGASIKHPYRLFLPERLYREFSILVAVKPDTTEPMFLFAVTNPLENLIQLGVSLTPGGPGSTNLSLYYTDGERHMTSQTIASFLVPQFTGSWTRLSLKVTEEEVQLWYNCQMYNGLLVRRVPLQLVFDSASTLYIGQAGGIFKGEFEGALQELKIYNVPDLAQVQCDNNFAYIGSGSGDGRSDVSVMDDYFPLDMEDDDESSLPRLEGSGVDLAGAPPPLPPPPPLHGAKRRKGSDCTTDHCQDVGVWACSGVEWTRAIFPNLLGQGPREAEPTASQFWHQLHTINCSREFRFVVCGLLAPPCAPGLTKPLPPCREVCDSALRSCLQIMEKYYLEWPKDAFTCQDLPYSHQEPCLRYHQGQVVFPPGVNTDCSQEDYNYDNYDYDGYESVSTPPGLHEDYLASGSGDGPDADLGFISSGERETYNEIYDLFDMPQDINITTITYTPSTTPAPPITTLTSPTTSSTPPTTSIPPTTSSTPLTTSPTPPTTSPTPLTTSPTPHSTTTPPEAAATASRSPTSWSPSTARPTDTSTPRIRFAPTPTPSMALPTRLPATSTDHGTSYLHANEIINEEFSLPGQKGEKGERGPKGPPGESVAGPPGPPGPPGLPGPPASFPHKSLTQSVPDLGSGAGEDFIPEPDFSSGRRGPPGPRGECFCNETRLLASVIAQIPRGLPGPEGKPGRDGVSGIPGTPGRPGPPGERGAPGEKGDKGDRGHHGSRGPEGVQGAKGESGIDGAPGLQGERGPQGPPGQPGWGNSGYDVDGGLAVAPARPGSPGSPGEKGEPGAAGSRGPRGYAGTKGEKGNPGSDGDKGERGSNGRQGLPGPKGEPGASGMNGAPGPPGFMSSPGAKGEKGERGVPGMGLPGPPGPPGGLSEKDRRIILQQVVETLENKNTVNGHSGSGINIWDTSGGLPYNGGKGGKI